jgi:Tfp pilus assembly protein PilZ
MIERRSFKRARVACQLQIQALAVDAPMIRNSFCSDVSPVGMAITTFDFYPVNKKVHLNILSNALNKVIEAIGRVVWVKELPTQQRFRIGIAFEDTSEYFVKQVETFIKEQLKG